MYELSVSCHARIGRMFAVSVVLLFILATSALAGSYSTLVSVDRSLSRDLLHGSGAVPSSKMMQVDAFGKVDSSVLPTYMLWLPGAVRATHLELLLASGLPSNDPSTKSLPSVAHYHTAYWQGQSLLVFQLHETATQAFQLSVTTAQVSTLLQPQRRGGKQLSSALGDLQKLVVNPEALPAAAIGSGKSAPRGFVPTSYPDLEGSAVEYLILCDASNVNDFQLLADWKTRRGIPTVVRSITSILQTARQGSDLGETIRNYVQDAYQLWGIRSLLLAADTDVIPARLARSSFRSPSVDIPSDLYYACLDGSWNANGNEIFGEAATGAQNLGDQVDLFPELYVSRAPVTTNLQAQRFVQKTIDYETPVMASYQNDVVLLAEVLSPANYDSGASIILDGSTLTEQLASSSLPPSLTLKKLYETDFLFPGSSQISKSASIDSMNRGPHWVNHMGHGFRFNMSVGDASILNFDAEALTNGNQSFLLFLLNCTALAFDSNSLGESYLLAANGGAVGVVGSSREAFPTTSIFYNENFFDAIFAQGHSSLGRAVVESRLPRTFFTFFETTDRWTHFILNVLGDAELDLYTGLPQLATLTFPDSIAANIDSVLIHVAVATVPVDSARVCLWKGDETYAVGYTNALGDIRLAVAADTPGQMLLTASGKNLKTFMGQIQVQQPLPAHPYVLSIAVDDDSLGASLGNANGAMDVGETVQLSIVIANSGGQPVTGLTGVLVVPDSVTAVVDTLALGSLLASDSLTTPNVAGTFVVQLARGMTDGTVMEFQLQFFDSTWTALGQDLVRKVVHAPRLEFVELLMSPSVAKTQGISGFVNQDLRLVLKNTGGGSQSALQGALTSLDPDVTVLQGSTQMNLIGIQATDTTTVMLQVAESNATQANPMQLDLTDLYGHVTSLVFNLRGIAAPTTVTLDASPGPTQMQIQWSAVADSNLLGFHCYRRLSSGGVFQRVNADLLAATFFIDSNLSPNTRYDYAVTSVNASRVHSPLSAFVSGSTNPPQLGGWPLPMSFPTSSSVAVGDIDGDGVSEVVIGNDGVWAWHANGQEILDGDLNALTWGLMSSETATITASIALANVIVTTPGLEIIACSWLDNRIWVYDGQGNVLPGWPVEPALAGSIGYWASPTVVDIDNDGRPDILAISKNGELYGFRFDGTPLVGAEGSFGTVGAFTLASPTVVNLDADPELEILVAGADSLLHAFNHDGTLVGGNFPISLGARSMSSPAVGEIDGNPASPEIVVTSQNNKVHVFTSSGFPLLGWPKTASMSSPSFAPSPALGDLNADGRAEIVIVANASPAENTLLVVYDGATGTVLLQRGLGNSSESSPILADVDGDGQVDIIVGGESGVINAWSLAGTVPDGFPLTVGDFVRGTPTFADVDADGDAEIILGAWDRTVYIWNLQVAFDSTTAPWPTYAGDVHRSGSGESAPGPPTDTPTGAPRPQRFQLLQNIPNPFNPSTLIRFALPQQSTVDLNIFDVRGHLVRQLWQGDLSVGYHERLWDGRDHSGRQVSTGIYWYRIQAGDFTATRKMLLVK